MKGRTWCIEFLDDAKKDGDVSVIWKVIRQGAQSDIRGTWEGYRAGMTARQKAERLEDRLTNDPAMSQMVGVHRAGNTVCIQLKDGAPFDDLAGVTIGDETGQTFRVYDDPAGPANAAPTETVRFGLKGKPHTPSGVVRLGVGIIPSPACAETFGREGPLPIESVLSGLADSFNRVFGPRGFKAEVVGDEVVIPEVPCDAGATAGTDDAGLTATLTVEDPGESMPAVADRSSLLRDMIEALHTRLIRLELTPSDPGHDQGHDPGHDSGDAGDGAGGGHPHCHGIVIQLGAGANRRYFLLCAGGCRDGAECRIHRSVNHHGGVREWCGCDDIEPTGCHIVLDTPGRGEGGGPTQVLCAGSCDDAALQCRLVRTRIPLPAPLPPMWVLHCAC